MCSTGRNFRSGTKTLIKKKSMAWETVALREEPIVVLLNGHIPLSLQYFSDWSEIQSALPHPEVPHQQLQPTVHKNCLKKKKTNIWPANHDVRAYNLSTWRVLAGGSGVPGHLHYAMNIKPILGYERMFKKQKQYFIGDDQEQTIFLSPPLSDTAKQPFTRCLQCATYYSRDDLGVCVYVICKVLPWASFMFGVWVLGRSPKDSRGQVGLL